MPQLIYNGFIDEIINGHSRTSCKRSYTGMKLRGHTQIKFPAERFYRFDSICFATFEIAVYPFFKILSEFVDGSSFIKNQGFVAHTLYLTAKAIVLFAVFHRTFVTFVFQVIHNSLY
ncbi:unknown [Prevotella sp. CAG:924]|nr:unknown [Prevotella sp. CAG:924]